jgi:sugar phosphate isomerase/epimerase
MDDIEIILFEAAPESPLPGIGTLNTLRQWADTCGTSYTVHLPLDLTLASADAGKRTHSIGLARQVIQATRSLNPWGYVVHVEHGEGWPGSWMEWHRLAETALKELLDEVAEPMSLCLENTEAVPPELTFALADGLDVSVCLDTGHLWKAELEPVSYLDGILSQTRIIHLHGWDGTRDHRSLKEMPPGYLDSVVKRLSKPPYGGVVTLEVFNEKDLLSSWECLAVSSQTN